MHAAFITRHFVPGNRLHLIFTVEDQPAGVVEIDAEITVVHGKTIIVELLSDGAAELMKLYGALEVTVASYRDGLYSRCVATASHYRSATQRTVLLHVVEVLETLPQRRDDQRIDLEIPVYVKCLPRQGKQEVHAIWGAEHAKRFGRPAPLLRRSSEGVYVSDWEGEPQVNAMPINLSSSGMMFYSGENQHPPLHFCADIFLPNAPISVDVVHVLGRVVRCRRLQPELEPEATMLAARRALGKPVAHRIAATFECISPRDRHLLSDYISKRGKL